MYVKSTRVLHTKPQPERRLPLHFRVHEDDQPNIQAKTQEERKKVFTIQICFQNEKLALHFIALFRL